MILLVPWPGMSTIESRGIDISRFGPSPMCSSMIVSVRWPLAPPVPSRLRSSATGPRASRCRRRGTSCPGWSSGRSPSGNASTVETFWQREDRDRDQEHDPEQQQRQDPAERSPGDAATSAGRAGRRRRCCRSARGGARRRRGLPVGLARPASPGWSRSRVRPGPLPVGRLRGSPGLRVVRGRDDLGGVVVVRRLRPAVQPVVLGRTRLGSLGAVRHAADATVQVVTDDRAPQPRCPRRTPG